MSRQLHIANGDDLAQNVIDLQLEGELVIWREMLCEGPTVYELGTNEFISTRTKFLKDTYNIPETEYKDQFLIELQKLTVCNGFDEVVLWFEFDLYSHMNMIAAISHLLENKKNMPVFLVCSKKLKDEKEHQILSQLPLGNLKNHYDHRIPLNEDDLEMANLIWQYYNGQNPQQLKSLIKRNTNFEYLSSCIRAHVERFPNSITGINTLEKNILKLIKTNTIINRNHLLGYSLEYQGYYGYGEMQMERLLDKIQLFYQPGEDQIELTQAGEEALNHQRNFYQQLKNNEFFGGVKMYDFLYESESHHILKL